MGGTPFNILWLPMAGLELIVTALAEICSRRRVQVEQLV
jgi:hypothetical protein